MQRGSFSRNPPAARALIPQRFTAGLTLVTFLAMAFSHTTKPRLQGTNANR